MQRRYGDTSVESMGKLFEAYDRDGDGHVSGDEFAQLLKDAGVGNSLTRGARVKGIVKALDQGSDQKVGRDEFSKAVG